jgi:5-methylcytosine-specific restriction endonuclease McrA
MKCKRRIALLLDRNYIPVKVISWKRAMQLVYGRGRAEILAFYEDAETEYDASVVRLTHRSFPGNPYNTKLKFYRRQVFIRDRFKCVYCGLDKKSDLTIDHVLPRSRGGDTSYANCVSACRRCNQYKGDKTPEEARMQFQHPPSAPIRGVILNILDIPSEWLVYLGR